MLFSLFQIFIPCVSTLQLNSSQFNLHNIYVLGSGLHVLKPKYSNVKSTRNYIKYSGLKKHLRQKTDLKRHPCGVCSKSFKSELMKKFHKHLYHVQLPHKELIGK